MISFYHKSEAIPAALAPVVFVFIGFLVHVIVIGCVSCRKWDRCRKDEQPCCHCCCSYCHCQVEDDGKIGYKKDFCKCFLWTWQSYATIVFPHSVVQRVKYGNDENGSSKKDVDDENGSSTDSREEVDDKNGSSREEVVLFAGIEPDHPEERRCFGCCVIGNVSCCKGRCTISDDRCGCTPSCCAISYLMGMIFWTIWFAFVVFWDSFLYSKLTRCADINTQDETITCFYINNNTQASCLDISARGQSADVICYALTARVFMAVGIAAGVGRVVIFATQIAFNIFLRIAQKCSSDDGMTACKTTGLSCIHILVVSPLIILPVLYLVLAAVLGRTSGANYVYANQPLRWLQFFLFLITMCSAMSVPWCAFVGRKSRYHRYTDVVAHVV